MACRISLTITCLAVVAGIGLSAKAGPAQGARPYPEDRMILGWMRQDRHGVSETIETGDPSSRKPNLDVSDCFTAKGGSAVEKAMVEKALAGLKGRPEAAGLESPAFRPSESKRAGRRSSLEVALPRRLPRASRGEASLRGGVLRRLRVRQTLPTAKPAVVCLQRVSERLSLQRPVGRLANGRRPLPFARFSRRRDRRSVTSGTTEGNYPGSGCLVRRPDAGLLHARKRGRRLPSLYNGSRDGRREADHLRGGHGRRRALLAARRRPAFHLLAMRRLRSLLVVRRHEHLSLPCRREVSATADLRSCAQRQALAPQ